jgi:hypothetical protein
MPAPTISLKSLDTRVHAACRRFWNVRSTQSRKQGSLTGVKDQGSRADVTGGKHIDGFIELVHDLLVENGVSSPDIYAGKAVDLPGYFRPEKKWDLLVVVERQLVAALEFKSQVGPSFGNNYNNRTEEAVGNAFDLRTAYREGAFRTSPKPWVGYLMLLEHSERSTRPVKVTESHFDVSGAFKDASYAARYEETIMRLLREGLYDGACFIMSQRTGNRTEVSEPNPELTFKRFAASLIGHALAVRAGGSSP